MNQIEKTKMKKWKKVTLISVSSFVLLLILIGVFMDKYKVGIENYNKKDYESAYNLLKQIKPEDKNYADASAKAAVCKRILDSLETVEMNSEALAKQKELAEEESKKATEKVKNEQENKIENNISEASSKTIPGLLPVDVYLNLEKKGFSIEKNFSAEYGCSWFCKSTYEGIDYDVTIFGSNASVVEEVRAQATINTAQNIQGSKDFFNYISSIPYENSDHEKVSAWLVTNFNKDKQSITVSGVTFTIYCPTKFGRLLTIVKEK